MKAALDEDISRAFPCFPHLHVLVFTCHVQPDERIHSCIPALPAHVYWTRGRWSFPGRGGGTAGARGTTDTRLPAAAREGTGLQNRREERLRDRALPLPMRPGPEEGSRPARSPTAAQRPHHPHPSFRVREPSVPLISRLYQESRLHKSRV